MRQTFALLVVTAAFADGPEQHSGFYMRMHLGPAYTSMSAELAGSEVEVKGSGGTFGVAIGGAVTENLIVFGEVFDDITSSPTMEIDGTEFETSGDLAAGVVGMGPGIAYYFVPVNIYVSGTLAFAKLTFQEDGEETGATEYGPGVSLMVGKEWWASQNWGLGVAAQVFAGSMKDEEEFGGEEVTWSARAFAIAFSATYN